MDVPAFFEGFDKLIAATTLTELKDYLEWFYINANAERLTKAMVNETFDFYGRTLNRRHRAAAPLETLHRSHRCATR